MIKGINKKGQSGGSGFTIVEMLIALAVLVVVAIGIWYFWGRSNQNFGALSPNVLDNLVLGCNNAISTNQNFKYCDFTEVTDTQGKKQYVNCDYPAIKAKLSGSTLVCTAGTEATECNNLKTQGKDMATTSVNGNVCSKTSGVIAS